MKKYFKKVLANYDPSEVYLFKDECNEDELPNNHINRNESQLFYAILSELERISKDIESLEYRVDDIEEELNIE
ncbi:MAG: hypothetical protein U0K53_01605 [Paludibacteraceae bacterium]|nr:hypothetical protein [Paludibacteraceae bacterium]